MVAEYIKVKVPEQLNKQSIPQLVSSVIDSQLNPVADKIDFDLTGVKFCEPSGVVALNNLVAWLNSKGKGTTLHIDNPDEYTDISNHKAMCYLEDSGFFENHFAKDVFKKAEIRSTMLSLIDLKVDNVTSWLNSKLIPFLQKNTGRDNTFTNIRIAVEEIFNNINDHSTEKIGSIFGQYYPKKNKIILVVSDFGIGIPNTMKKKFAANSDKEFLEKAFQQGATTQSSPKNRGAGIPNIANAITTNGVGTVHLKSNYGILSIEDREIVISKDEKVFYPGTFYQLEIDVSNEDLYDLEEEEDFEW